MIDKIKSIWNSEIANLIIDWLSCISLFVIIKIFDALVPPFQREFSLDDQTIQYSHLTKETVPNWLLWVLGLALPAVVILISYVKVKNSERVHLALIGLLLSSGLAYFITHFLKNLIGRLRPDFIARCQPSEDLVKQSKQLYQLVTSTVCTQTDASLLRGGRQSFPSGHTSTSFSGLGFLSIYLFHALQLSHRRAGLYQYYAVLLPLAVAAFVGVSRISNYRHHWQDVTVGMIIGLLCAYFAFKKYYKHRIHLQGKNQLISSEDNVLNDFGH